MGNGHITSIHMNDVEHLKPKCRPGQACSANSLPFCFTLGLFDFVLRAFGAQAV